MLFIIVVYVCDVIEKRYESKCKNVQKSIIDDISLPAFRFHLCYECTYVCTYVCTVFDLAQNFIRTVYVYYVHTYIHTYV